MTRKECFTILGLPEDADMAAIKQAYRKLAFALHPDLNPEVADASKRFQLLNEAYVFLSQSEAKISSASPNHDPGSAKAREEAHKAYDKAKAAQQQEAEQQKTSSHSPQAKQEPEDVLSDILNDPFARRVFEDIYSHIGQKQHNHKKNTSKAASSQTPSKAKSKAPKPHRQQQKSQPIKNELIQKVSGWLRKQIDEQQTLRLPGNSLVPGARLMLQIQHGFTASPRSIEIVLPPDYAPGQLIRLKGMGKHLGSWKGDLYIRLESS